MSRIARVTRDALDAAVAAGVAPHGSRGFQQGLLVRPPNGRAIRLFNDASQINAAGTDYFEQRAQVPPNRGFDPKPEPFSIGRREQILLKDGSTAVLRHLVGKTWRFTKMGLSFYRDKRTKYFVYVPSINV